MAEKQLGLPRGMANQNQPFLINRANNRLTERYCRSFHWWWKHKVVVGFVVVVVCLRRGIKRSSKVVKNHQKSPGCRRPRSRKGKPRSRRSLPTSITINVSQNHPRTEPGKPPTYQLEPPHPLQSPLPWAKTTLEPVITLTDLQEPPYPPQSPGGGGGGSAKFLSKDLNHCF